MPNPINVGGLLPPSKVTEFLIYRAPFAISYEMFIFPVSLAPLLEGFSKGHKMSCPVTEVKTYIFDEMDDLSTRNALAKWFKSVGIDEPDRAVDKCSVWRLVHFVVPSTYYPPKFQGYPIQEEDWKRMPTQIKQESRKPVDMFDPLNAYLDPSSSTFSLFDDFLR